LIERLPMTPGMSTLLFALDAGKLLNLTAAVYGEHQERRL
jgi:hypothetical protein